ncbi:hypothetical protein BJ170DRAFT_30557 [Xylariales sp. AK1849]|nr:hypothetical protein BJ170DRAFT_30557 [Xylariales sp. AK1849]
MQRGETTESSNVPSESDDQASPEDPIERRKAQNRAAQRNHRKRMKRRLEQLEKRLESQGTSPIQPQQRSLQIAPNYALATIERQSTEFTNLELTTGGIGPFPLDASEASQLMDPIIYPDMIRASTDSLKPASFGGTPILPSSPESGRQCGSFGIYEYGSLCSLDQRPGLFGNNELNSPSLGLDSRSTAQSALMLQYHNAASAEDRMSRVIEFAQAAGFRDLDALATEYYVGKFDEASYVSAAQRTSRSRQLRGLLERLRTSAQSWSEYEAHGYHQEISQSAEVLYVAELDAFTTDIENGASRTSVMGGFQNLAVLPRSESDGLLRKEGYAVQNELPNLWSLISELVATPIFQRQTNRQMVLVVIALLNFSRTPNAEMPSWILPMLQEIEGSKESAI